jgi:hypothetical protein
VTGGDFRYGHGTRIAKPLIEHKCRGGNEHDEGDRDGPSRKPVTRSFSCNSVAGFFGHAARELRQRGVAFCSSDCTRFALGVEGAFVIAKDGNRGTAGIWRSMTRLPTQQWPEQCAKRGGDQQRGEQPEEQHRIK